MTLKLRNFINIVNIVEVFNKKNDSIYLIVHQSDLNIKQNNILFTYCKQENIQRLNVKSKLFKKLTKNSLVSNLFVGPTKIFLFNNPITFLNFLKTVPFAEKIIPLSVYFNNQFFAYSLFKNEVLKLQNQSIVSLKISRLLLMNNIFMSPKIFLKQLNIIFFNFIKLLSYIKNTK